MSVVLTGIRGSYLNSSIADRFIKSLFNLQVVNQDFVDEKCQYTITRENTLDGSFDICTETHIYEENWRIYEN